jgi:hypothetical protein
MAIGVDRLTFGFVEAIDTYGQIMRGERAQNEMGSQVTLYFFDDLAGQNPARPPTVDERVALLNIAVVNNDPTQSIIDTVRTYADASQYISEAFGETIDFTATAPVATPAPTNVSGQPAVAYILPTAPWLDEQDYGQAPPELSPAAAVYWAPPAPTVDPYATNPASTPTDPGQPGDPGDPGGEGGEAGEVG